MAMTKEKTDEFRSTNGQLQWIVAEALRKARRLPKHGTAAPDNDTDNT